MPAVTPSDLREMSRLFRRMASEENTPVLKRFLARHALALVQLAEKIERAKVEECDDPWALSGPK